MILICIDRVQFSGEGNKYQVKFNDPKVCKSFLLACCPHEILSSTVSVFVACCQQKYATRLRESNYWQHFIIPNFFYKVCRFFFYSLALTFVCHTYRKLFKKIGILTIWNSDSGISLTLIAELYFQTRQFSNTITWR